MSKPASVLLFCKAYIVETLFLTLEEQGAYARLLVIAYGDFNGSIPNDDKKIAKLLGVGTRRWAKLKPAILPFWQKQNDRLVHVGRATQRPSRESIPAAIRRAIFDRDGQRCTYCGTEQGPFELDHIHPWSRGGRDTTDNLCVSCKPCNIAKSDKLLSELNA